MKAVYSHGSRLLIITLLLLTLYHHEIFGQISVPYSNNFDQLEDTTGWTHYAIEGADDWELSSATGHSYSSPNGWVANIDASYTPYSNRVLQTPAFDLSTIGENYNLSFYQKRQNLSTSSSFFIEYSVNDGTWLPLNNTNAQKKNWMGSNGFPVSNISSFSKSSINLSFLAGVANIKFRFRIMTPTGGSLFIDNFSIGEDYYNVYATPGDSIQISQNCPTILVNSDLIYQNQYTSSYENTTLYYLSSNTILDDQDQLIFTKENTLAGSDINFTQSITNDLELEPGNYYIIYHHDALNVLEEANESDNIGWASIEVIPVYSAPFIDDFDSNLDEWSTYFSSATSLPVWAKGSGTRHHIEGTHSGQNAWHTGASIQVEQDLEISGTHYVESPYIDFSSVQGTPVLNVWFKNQIEANVYRIMSSQSCGGSFSNLLNFPENEEDEWDYLNVSLSNFASNNNVRFAITYSNSYQKPEGIIFDDFYVGTAKADLSIEREKADRFTITTDAMGSIKYYLNNCGIVDASATITSFYWSSDTIFDATDLFIGTKQEASLNAEMAVWTTFEFVKPTDAEGNYYIFYTVDSEQALDEMREYNNTGYFTLHQQQLLTLPYSNDFETDIDQWRHNASLGADDWKWIVPNGAMLNQAFSGEKAFLATGSDAPLTPMSRSHLYSPVFDLTSTEHPVLEVDMKLFSNGITLGNAKMNMSYSVDGGANWIVLDTNSQSFNRWYYWMEYEAGGDDDYYLPYRSELLFARDEEHVFPGVDDYNGRDAARNTHYVLDLTFLADMPQVQFRYNLATLLNTPYNSYPSAEGVMVDNFIIREGFTDFEVEYQKSLMISSIVEDVRFFMSIKNQGNYLTDETAVNYFLSSDTQLDDSDFFLGTKSIPSIRPDLSHYLNVSYPAPSDLENYSYLIYDLDATNVNSESNEMNNIGYWPLSLDSVNTFPYLADFNNAVIDGWHQFSLDPYDDTTLSNYRFRNILAPGEPIYQTDMESGQFFTERVQTYSTSWIPTFYLESPSFDFSDYGNIQLSFDLMCTGKHSSVYYDGGNLQFSTNGGNTWLVLTEQFGDAFNWYDYEQMGGLDNQDGWSGQPAGYGIAELDSCAFDLSFLGGQQHVVFRFKYRSNHHFNGPGTVQGMRVDNFMINAQPVDILTNDFMIPVSADYTQTNFNIDYAIQCISQTFCSPTKTKFYWSADNVLDSSDPMILLQNELQIAPETTINLNATITYPLPLMQSTYYLFYVIDQTDVINETNEENNIGSFVINFPGFVLGVENPAASAMRAYVVDHVLYLITNESLTLPSTLKLTSMEGKLLHSEKIIPGKGVNQYILPQTLAAGIYHASIETGSERTVIKVVVR